jgi:Rne/Rng family ribonuclease
MTRKKEEDLRNIARSILPKNMDLIIRTVARNQNEDILKEDLNNLLKTWQEIESTAKSETRLHLIYQDLNTTSSVIRDLLHRIYQKYLLIQRSLYKQIKSYITAYTS